MRRAQSVRHYARPSLALGADDLGVLRENDESNEDILRRQLLDKDRENDKLQTQIQTLQAQLAQRPSLETVQALEKEYKHLELLLQGTQRENERCMTELERGKTREKMLERELAKLAGENWQTSLDISPSVNTRSGLLHQRSNTASSSLSVSSPASNPHPLHSFNQSNTTSSNEKQHGEQQQQDQQQATLAHIEQVRMLILGMEQRLQTREEKLAKTIERAEHEGKRFEDLGRGVMAGS